MPCKYAVQSRAFQILLKKLTKQLADRNASIDGLSLEIINNAKLQEGLSLEIVNNNELQDPQVSLPEVPELTVGKWVQGGQVVGAAILNVAHVRH